MSRSSLWERKCAILEEELEFRRQQMSELQAKLEEEMKIKEQQEFVKRKQFTEIQRLKQSAHDMHAESSRIERIEKSNNEENMKLEQQLNDFARIKEHNEQILQQQQQAIQELIQDLEKERAKAAAQPPPSPASSGPAPAAPENSSSGGRGPTPPPPISAGSENDSEELRDLRDQLIKSRKKEAELLRMEENWKEKVMELERRIKIMS